MTLQEHFYRFALALGIGLLIGIQREAMSDADQAKLTAGARTFALISLAGYILALVSEYTGSGLPFLGGMIALGILLALGYWQDLQVSKPGMTTEMAAIAAFGTGALCHWGMIAVAAAIGVAITALLSFKHEFRSLTNAITREDVYAIVKFAAISVIVLPVLPNQAYGPPPLNVLNPFNIWLMVVFTSGISFLGYVLIKIAGTRRGIALTGLLGGVASSTALTLSFSQRSREDEELSRPFAMAMLVAWLVMYVRVLVIVFVLAPNLATRLVAPVGVVASVGVAYGAYLYFAQRDADTEDVAFSNPFSLGPAIRFGVLYGAILLVSRAAQVALGDLGVYISSFVSGLLDADAITLSLVDLLQTSRDLTSQVAARAIVIACVANTLFKGGFALVAGSSRLRRSLWPAVALMTVVGIGTTLLM